MTAPRSPWLHTEPNIPNVVPDPQPVVHVEPELAELDLLIARRDLGPDAATFVAAGDEIPAALAELPRRPAHPNQPTKRRR